MTSQIQPPFRMLRGYAFDPSLSTKIDTALINDIIYKVTWEDNLEPGPKGEYIEVIDYDPTVKKFYTPVNLDDKYLLAQDGLAPSESNPQFHQQMVYAVAMTTIKNFEKALGRPVLWSPNKTIVDRPTSPTNDATIPRGKICDEYIGQLRIYPHAFRDANAYYSPQKKALLFGYFSAQPAEITLQMPNSLVFTCLSHDIIAHETTHAILDGMYNKYVEDTNPDMLAFHEAFADIVALFQHFTFPDVLRSQIAKTRGDLTSQNLLGELAMQFGTAIGSYGSLRDAIGYFEEGSNIWKPKKPNGDEYRKVMEPHARGSILVAAIFDAFLTIYKSRIADLTRIASGGTGILPQGELHPDVVSRLCQEAAKTAGHVLGMCIRALDYCPPVDITFGEYLRAIITADVNLVADDNRNYRIAFIDAFRKRGIYPGGITNLSVQSLCYTRPDVGNLQNLFHVVIDFLKEFRGKIIYINKREELFSITRDYIASNFVNKPPIMGLHRRIGNKFDNEIDFEKITGLVFNNDWEAYGIATSTAYNSTGPSFEVHSLQLASRVGPDGNQSNQIIVSIVQKCGIVVSELDNGVKVTCFPADKQQKPEGGIILSGGCTLIFNLDTMELKYAISKPLLDVAALEKGIHQICPTRSELLDRYYADGRDTESAFDAYFTRGKQFCSNEPFAFLHAH